MIILSTKEKLKRKLKRIQIIESGYCPSHTKVKVVKGKRKCLKCETHNRRYVKEFDKRGWCRGHRGVKAVPGHTRCQPCLNSLRVCELRRRCNLSDEEVDLARKALASFNGRCDSCGTDNPGHYWCCDHDQENKLFRGIVCLRCNLALGYVGDNIQKLEFLIEYLRRVHARRKDIFK